MLKTVTDRTDDYQDITNQIISQLEAGVRPWTQPWSAQHLAGRVTRPLRFNGEQYSGINIIVLWMSAVVRGFASPYWLTFKQASELGGHVKKGEHGSKVVYYGTIHRTESNQEGEDEEKAIPYLKQYVVFNSDQCEGLPEKYQEIVPHSPLTTMDRIRQAESFFAGTKADIREGGNRAFYSLESDYIRMPPFLAFESAESHAATLAHELVHWTRHPSRLNRDMGRKQWGDAGYAMEELVAELGSCFLGADLVVTPDIREDHASYIDSWLKVLKSDKRAIFTAASQASKAVEYLHSLQPVTTD